MRIAKEYVKDLAAAGVILLIAGSFYLNQTRFEIKTSELTISAGTDIACLVDERYVPVYADVGSRVNVTVDASGVDPYIEGEYFIYVINNDTGEKLKVKVNVEDTLDPDVEFADSVPDLQTGEILDVSQLIVSAADASGIGKEYFELSNGSRETSFTAGDPGYYPMSVVVEDNNGRQTRKEIEINVVSASGPVQ